LVIDEGGPSANMQAVTSGAFSMGKVDANTRRIVYLHAQAIVNWFKVVKDLKLFNHCLKGLMDTVPMPRYQDISYVLPVSRSASPAQRANASIRTEYDEIVASCRLYKQQSRQGDGQDAPRLTFTERLDKARKLKAAMLDQTDMWDENPDQSVTRVGQLKPVELDVIALRQVVRTYIGVKGFHDSTKGESHNTDDHASLVGPS